MVQILMDVRLPHLERQAFVESRTHWYLVEDISERHPRILCLTSGITAE